MATEPDDHRKKATTESGLRVLSPETRPEPDSPDPAPEPQPAESKPRKLAPRHSTGDVVADKYRLGRKLGEGGMGEVWLAHNETLDIDVAIKVIRGETASEDLADRLLNEARAAARLGHPAIVRVNDFGKTATGDPFIVMELLDGEDLASALAKRGRLSAIKAVRTLLPIAHALTVAHNKGIVHRDLKPENIYLAKTDDGQMQPKLVDFGVAKLEKPHSHRLTQSGALLGSPLYMSPEQARGDDVDHRADIWALAVVLYEAITGRPPFEGKNYNAVLYSIIANPPTPITDLDVGDAELWTILERAFQKDPDRRWYSMRDFGEALAHWLADRNVQDDITGASLQTAWMQWKKDEDQLAPGPSQRPPPDGDDAVLPPLPLPPDMGPASLRDREITVRGQRQRNRVLMVVGGVALFGLFMVVAALLSARSGPSTGIASSPTHAALSSAEPAAQDEAPAPDDPEHERAVEEALATTEAREATRATHTAAPARTAAPAARAPTAAAAPPPAPQPEKPHPAAAPASRPALSTSKGIYTSDPYRATKPLKNPF